MFFKSILITFITFCSCVIAGAAEGGGHHQLPRYAEEVFSLGPLVITNSMVITISAAILLILFAQLATRKMEMVPSGLQNFAEWLIEGLYSFLEGLMGPQLVKKTFYFFATIFIFILATNWFGLIPGVGTVGTMGSDGHFTPWLRGGNADLNMTLAMSMVFFVMWFVWVIQSIGFGGMVKHIFVPTKAHWAIAIIFFAVGFIEIISIVMRPVALTFRLYGNVFAGENLLETMLAMKPFGWIIPLPFYFLELLVGIIQASVFMLLTALFTNIMCTHDDHDHDHDDHHEDDHATAPASESAPATTQ